MDLSPNESVTLQRLTVLGLSPGEALEIIRAIHTWVRESGLEWTVSRLKAMKTDYVRLLAGSDRDPKTWVAFRGNAPKGPFRPVFKLKGKKSSWRALNALMVYTQFISTKVTDKQWKKFSESVERPSTYTYSANDLNVEIFEPFRKEIGKILKTSKHTRLEDFISSEKRAPVIETTIRDEEQRTYRSRLTTCVETESSFTSNLMPLCTNPGRRLYARYQEEFDAVIPDEYKDEFRTYYSMASFNMLDSKGENLANIPYVGRIGFIQEPGFKLRAVANPFRIYQAALSRLGNALFDILKLLPWDYTHNQELGISWAQQKLKEGKTLHSIDLSDATNNFPRELQVILLKELEAPSVDLFESVSSESWYCEQSQHKNLRWTVGQPLGLYPSFAAFALTHGAIVRTIEEKYSLSDTFAILGDDIVISDEQVANHYRGFLERAGCPVSESKCITSSRVAEFAGRVIMTDSVIHGIKWRGVSDDSFLDLMRNLGPRAAKLLSPRQRRVYERIKGLPEFMGGFGLNPEGKPFEDRIRGFEYLMESTVVPYVSDTRVRSPHKGDSALARELTAYPLRTLAPTRSKPLPNKVLDGLHRLGFPIGSTFTQLLREKEKRDVDGALKYVPILLSEFGSTRRAGYRVSNLVLWETRLRQLQG